jgi:hypothetical protein
MSQGSIAFVSANNEFFTQAMHLAAFRTSEMGWDLEPLVQALQTNQVVTASSEAFAAAMRVLLAAGDSILLRIKYARCLARLCCCDDLSGITLPRRMCT